jgi:hypothetical protein
MQWFTEQQGLEWSFGTASHRFNTKGRCPACEGQDVGRPKKRKYVDI